MFEDETIFGTINENMTMALQSEQHMLSTGPSDPYYRIAQKNMDYYLECAAALERGERTIKRRTIG